MCALLAIQQISVAASIVFLAQFAREAAEGRLNLGLFSGYLFSIIFPYLPGGLALVEQRKWELASEKEFLDRGSAFLYGRTEVWSSTKLRDRYTSIYAKDSLAILSGISAWAYAVCANSMNTLLSISAVAWAVDPRFLIGIGISLLLATNLLRFQAPRMEHFARETQGEFVTLSAELIHVWDNTTLGNRSSFSRWRSESASRFNRAKTNALRETRFATGVSIGITLVTFIPPIVIVVWGIIREGRDMPYVMGLVVTLPRLFQILNTSHTLLSYISEWSAQRGRLAILADFFVPPPKPDLESRIKFDAIHATPIVTTLNVETLEAALAKPTRITLMGPNGSGKTSLLLLLKLRLGDRAFYLPPHHRLYRSDSEDPASTGEAASRILEDLRRNETAPVLLLDEWDANLDRTNRTRLSRIIDELAQTRGIVEVRHGHPNPAGIEEWNGL